MDSERSKKESFVYDLFEKFPKNKSREIVTLKVEALLDFMGNPHRIHQRYIISHILSDKNFDNKLQRGVKSIVDGIANTSPSKHYKYDDFARFYCAFHNIELYLSGFALTTTLWSYEYLDHFLQGDTFYSGNRYAPYVKLFNRFIDFYGLRDYPIWDLQLALYQFSVDEFHESQRRSPCKDLMGYSQNSYNLSIINAANQRNED